VIVQARELWRGQTLQFWAESTIADRGVNVAILSKNVTVVYFAGLLQGLALVSFPATSSIFTNAQKFNLSSAEYGGLFIPQAILSIIVSLLSTKLTRLKGIKFVFVLGLAANLLSMFLFAMSSFLVKQPTAAYGILLLATACLGAGFGLTVPSLNNFAAQFFPKKIDSAVLVLNALLGSGTALAPILVMFFIDFGFWWGLPSLLAFLLLALLLFSLPSSLQGKIQQQVNTTKQSSFPKLFWLFIVFALVYGILETINGNWAMIYMNKNLHATPRLAILLGMLSFMITTKIRAIGLQKKMN